MKSHAGRRSRKKITTAGSNNKGGHSGQWVALSAVAVGLCEAVLNVVFSVFNVSWGPWEHNERW